MSNPSVVVEVGDVYGTVTRKKKGPKAVFTYRGKMVVFTNHHPPIYRGLHGVPLDDKDIEAFLNEGIHPYIEFSGSEQVAVCMDGYSPLVIDFTDESVLPNTPMSATPLPDLSLSGKLVFGLASAGVFGISIYRLFTNH